MHVIVSKCFEHLGVPAVRRDLIARECRVADDVTNLAALLHDGSYRVQMVPNIMEVLEHVWGQYLAALTCKNPPAYIV